MSAISTDNWLRPNERNCGVMQMKYVHRLATGRNLCVGGRGQLSGRAPDSLSKGRGLEGQFSSPVQLSVLTLILVSIPPPYFCSNT